MKNALELSMRGAVLCLCLSLAVKAAGPPELSAHDIVSAADHSGGRVSPGEIVVLHPANAGPDVLAGAQLDNNGRVTRFLGETRVLFDGVAAPIAYTVSGEVGVIVPYEVANRKTTGVVVEYQGARSAPVTMAVVASTPALFTLDSSGKGQAAMLNETGCCNSTRNPATQGSIAALYATGAGQTIPRGVTGRVSAYAKIRDYPVPRLPVRVSVGGKAAEIVYAGAAPHAVAGLLQVNFRVPRDAPAGDAIPIFLTIGGTRSPAGVTMAIRPEVQQILLVEADSASRSRLTRILKNAGYEVYTAQNDAAALEQIDLHRFDLVICSLARPEQDLLEAIRKKRAGQPPIRIIAIAKALDAGALRDADLLGAQKVLTSAMGSQATLQRVREILKARPAVYFADEKGPSFPLGRPLQR